jgi:hypothetical protein
MALLKSQGRGHGVVEVEGAGSLSVGQRQRPIGEVWSTAERTTPLRLRPAWDTPNPKRALKGTPPPLQADLSAPLARARTVK